MNHDQSSELQSIIRTLPVRCACDAEIPEIVDKFVSALVTVGIDAHDESRGVSFPYPGVPPADGLLSDLIIGIVDLRFRAILESGMHRDVSEANDRSTNCKEVLAQADVQFIGGLSHSEIIGRTRSLLSAFDITAPEEQVLEGNYGVDISESGRTSIDSSLISFVVELMQRRYSAERARERYAGRRPSRHTRD